MSTVASIGSCFESLANTIISPFYTLVSTNATYCFTARTNVRNHKTETETLEGSLLRVKQRITDGERNGLIPTDEADRWVQRVEQAISEEAANRESFDNRCRIFGCPLNCWGNYKISKQAAEKLVAVTKYISSTPPSDNITCIPPPPPVVGFRTHSVQFPPSREGTLRDALSCINDNPAVGAIGIWGPDRDEKTNLLKKINDSFLGECLFDFVIFVTASSECSVQAQIVSRLRTNPVPDVATQATRISELLETKSFLLLVDDLRVQLDLKAIGIPYPLGDVAVMEVVEAVQVSRQVQRKVIVTSRSQSICRLMDVEWYIKVPDLGEDEARQLFAKQYGAQDPYSDRSIGALAQDLVRELKGLPSDLTRYGKLMQGIRDVRQWEVAIDAVRKANLQMDDPLNLAEKTVRNLENVTEDLRAKGSDIRREIANADRQHKTATKEVKRWLIKVDTIIRDVKVISWDCRQLKKDVTMEASEKLREVQECLTSCPSIVAVESMPPPVQEIPGPSMTAQNRNMQDALKYIKDDPKVGMIGIWGPGGVGKTYLLKNINNSFGEEITFNFVLFVTASRGCSVEKVQSQIIEKLGLPSTGSKSNTIHQYMKTKSFLVLLDDLWDQINLEDVGIPYPLGYVDHMKRKVVLTTRLRKVCGQMEVRKEIKVPYLEEHEAWQLFEKSIGAKTLSSPHIEALARELVKELKGLPLALTTIGKAMYQKETAQWETAIQYMQQSCCTDDKDPVELGVETNIFRQLKFSYDNLRNDTLRFCFLTCALWPEDEKIPKVDLAQCWIGLGLVNEQDIESSFRKSYSLIADLTAACLLEGWGDWYGYVEVHDVLRDMALWISCDCGEKNDKWIVRAPVDIIPWNRVKKTTECLPLAKSYASYVTRVTQLVPTGFSPMNLRILCLQNNLVGERVIVEAIKYCASLTYLDLRRNELKRIPDELASLGKLEYLDLSENDLGTTEVPRSFGKLISLKFLYLKHTSIRTIPAEVISSLKSLQGLDLTTLRTMSPVYRDPVVLFRDLGTLPLLKVLGIEAIGDAELESIRKAAYLPIRYLTLTNLGTGEFCLSGFLSNDSAQRTLYDLHIRHCDSHQITVRHDTLQPNNHFGALNKLRIVATPYLKEITWMGANPVSIFPSLTFLDLNGCEGLLHLSWVIYLPRLEQLHIYRCSSMVQAFMGCDGDKLCNGQEKTKTFPCLKFLRLFFNVSLDTIGDNGMEFPSLEQLVISVCPKLKRLPFQLDSLPLNLKELLLDDIEDWKRLECEEGVKTFLQTTLRCRRNLSS